MSHPPTPPAVPPGGTDREIPKQVRYFTAGFVFRKITLKEAWQIACGRHLAIEVHIATEHRPGAMKPLIEVHTTKATTGQAAMEERALKARVTKLSGQREQHQRDQAARKLSANPAATPPTTPPKAQ